MRAKKLLSMLLVVSMVGAMMTGCGNKETNTDTTADTSVVDTSAAATQQETESGALAATETTEAEDPAEGVEIAAGTYAGSYTKEAMGSEIVYNYTLTLKEDNTYVYNVSFEMSGTEYPEEETGTYAAEGTTLVLTSETPLKDLDTAITVTSAEAGKIHFSRCVSSFASAQVDLEASFIQE